MMLDKIDIAAACVSEANQVHQPSAPQTAVFDQLAYKADKQMVGLAHGNLE